MGAFRPGYADGHRLLYVVRTRRRAVKDHQPG